MSCYTSAEMSENAADDAEEEEYYRNLAIWMREQEKKREEEEQKNEYDYYESYEPIYREHNKVSRGTHAQRRRSLMKMNNFAQAVLTGTIDQTKKNTKKYKNSIVGQVFTDALPQHVKTLDARREHRKREINLARLSKIDTNTANPTLSEQREMNDIEVKEFNDFWEDIQMQEIEQRQESWNDIDRREHRYVGDMLGREHLANVNSCYY